VQAYTGVWGQSPQQGSGAELSHIQGGPKNQRGFEDECGRELGLQYRVGQKSKLLILSEYVSKTEKIGEM